MLYLKFNSKIILSNSDNYKICKKTVMDSSDPHIYFDENGISNHYWDFLKYSKPNLLFYKNGLNLLDKEVQKIKNESKGKDFDCILGLSGGMDSSFMLHTMVTKYNLKPLVFHVDGGWNTELTVNNINNLVDKLGLDLFTEVIDWNEMKNFNWQCLNLEYLILISSRHGIFLLFYISLQKNIMLKQY